MNKFRLPNSVRECLRKIPVTGWLLLAIIFAGVFLRTYHFSEWLIFSPDQARDAMLVDAAVQGRTGLPLVGPQAGNTKFYLGPLYYHMQYVSERLFGMSPQAMAFPDWFFGILAIPLTFLLWRRYFSDWTAAGLTALLSGSYFFVEVSRFALNPNSIPFFLALFLIGLLEMVERMSSRRALYGSLLVGIGIGAGMQLHTLLLFSLPATVGLVLAWLWWRGRLAWRDVAVLITAVLVLNTGQIVSEWQTGARSTRALWDGVTEHSGQESRFAVDAGLIAACQLQANAHIVSGLVSAETCGRMFVPTDGSRWRDISYWWLRDHGFFVAGIVLSLVFSLGGYALWARALWRETGSRRRFLGVLAVYQVVTLIVCIPVAREIGTKYFIVLFFVPFVLLGLWSDWVRARWTRAGAVSSAVVLLGLLMANGEVMATRVRALEAGQGNDVETSILGELPPMLAYIFEHADPSQEEVCFSGKTLYHKRFYKGLAYLSEREYGRELKLCDDPEKIVPGTQLFWVVKTSGKPYQPGERLDGMTVEGARTFGKVMIYIVRL